MFEGNVKKLEPHLDLLTGCVEVTYKGDNKNFKIFYEVWEKGIKKQNVVCMSSRGIEDMFKETRISVSAKKTESKNPQRPTK